MLNRNIVPEVYPFGQLNMLPERKFTLSNGITVHIVDHKEQDVTRISFVWQGGSKDVPSPAELGLAISMIREGCDSKTSSEISETLDYNGAWLVPLALGGHYSGLTLFALNSKLKSVLPLLVDCITTATIPQKEFNVARERALRKLEINLKKVGFISSRDNIKMVYGKEHPAVDRETPESIMQIEASQVKRLQRSICVPDNCHVYISGNVTDEVETFIITQLNRFEISTKAVPLIIDPFQPQEPGENLIDVPSSMQSAINISFPIDINRAHDHYNPLRLAVTALGGYFGSRLSANIREDKGYTYGIVAGLLGNKEGSYVTITTQANNAFVRPVIHETFNEIDRLATELMDDDEVKRLKSYSTSQLAEILDSPFSIGDYYMNQLSVDTPKDYFRMYQKAISDITPEIICKMIQTYVRPNLARISIAGAISQI